MARDYATLRRIEAEGYVYTEADAKVTTRDEFIRSYQAGTSTIRLLRFDDMAVDVYDAVAVVRGVLTVEREAEIPSSSCRHTYATLILYVTRAGEAMAVRKKSKPAKRVRENASGSRFVPAAKPFSREGKVRKEFWLDPGLLREAQKYLGASTERETVEMALDLVAFRKELSQGARVLRRLPLSRID